MEVMLWHNTNMWCYNCYNYTRCAARIQDRWREGFVGELQDIPLIHSFIQHPQCASYWARYWGYSSEQD